MNILGMYKDFQEKLLENSSGITAVYREAFNPPASDPLTGYIVWNFDTQYVEEISTGHTGPVEGQLEVMVFCQDDATRYTLAVDVMDIFIPYNATTQKREGIGPVQLTNTFLHAVYLEGTIVDLQIDNEGAPGPDVPGVSIPFRVKISPGEV
jgi:hypothetical protein